MLAVVLKVHEEEMNKMGYDILEIGVHSIRKGARTPFISSGTTAAPSSMSFNLQGGWSMGSVRDIYMLYKKAGDQYIGRLTAGLPVLLEKFAVSDPDVIPVEENDVGLFVPVQKTPENEAELKEKIQAVIEGIFGCQIPNVIRPFLRIGLACHLHHRPKLDVLHPNDSALRLTALFTSRHIKDLQDHVKVGFPSDEDFSMYWEEPTGIPPHIIELAKLAVVKRMVGDILPAVEKIVTKQLDDRTVNGVLSRARMRTLIEGVFDERVMPLVNAMAVNRESAIAAGEKPPGAIEESEDGFFFQSPRKLAQSSWGFDFSTLPPSYRIQAGPLWRRNSRHIANQQ